MPKPVGRALLVAVLLLAACGSPAPERDADAPATRLATEPTAPPDQAVAMTADHRLVVVTVATGEVVRELATGDDPEDFGGPGEEPFAGGQFLDSVAVGQSGAEAFYSTCCEPAPGSLHAVALTGGAPRRVGVGYGPAVSPDGERVAVVEMQWITILDTAGAVLHRIQGGPRGPVAIGRLAWSPDGATLALERFEDSMAEPRIQLIAAGAADMDQARDVAGGQGWSHPAFDADGRLLVARQPRDQRGDPTGAAAQLLVDPATGEVLEERELPAGVRSQVYDAGGTFALTVLSDGSARWRGDGRSGTVAGEFTSAAW